MMLVGGNEVMRWEVMRWVMRWEVMRWEVMWWEVVRWRWEAAGWWLCSPPHGVVGQLSYPLAHF